MATQYTDWPIPGRAKPLAQAKGMPQSDHVQRFEAPPDVRDYRKSQRPPGHHVGRGGDGPRTLRAAATCALMPSWLERRPFVGQTTMGIKGAFAGSPTVDSVELREKCGLVASRDFAKIFAPLRRPGLRNMGCESSCLDLACPEGRPGHHDPFACFGACLSVCMNS